MDTLAAVILQAKRNGRWDEGILGKMRLRDRQLLNNQSNNQSVSQSLNQSISQSVSQSVSQSINQLIPIW